MSSLKKQNPVLTFMVIYCKLFLGTIIILLKDIEMEKFF